MACGAAITITKARVTNEQIRGLLTAPIVEAIVQAWAEEQQLRGISVGVYRDTVNLASWAGDVQYNVTTGEITGRGLSRTYVDDLAKTIQQFGGKLLTNLLMGVLAKAAGKQPSVTYAEGEEAGVVKTYAVLQVTY